MGFLSGILSSKKKSKSYLTPWAEGEKYILGDEESGVKGYLPESGRLYNSGGWNDAMQGGWRRIS